MPDDVPEEVKRRRNNELLAVQNAISEEDNQPLVGPTLEILVEGPSKTSLKRAEEGPVVQLTGRDALRPDRGLRGAPRNDWHDRLPADHRGQPLHALRSAALIQ